MLFPYQQLSFIFILVEYLIFEGKQKKKLILKRKVTLTLFANMKRKVSENQKDLDYQEERQVQ